MGVIQTKRLHWNSAKRITSKYDINPKRTPQIGLNRITRKQNVSILRILQYSFCEERKHLSRSMKFIRTTFSLITMAITRSPFSCCDRAQNFSESKVIATSFPGSFFYFEKVPWLRLVTCLLDFCRFQKNNWREWQDSERFVLHVNWYWAQ